MPSLLALAAACRRCAAPGPQQMSVFVVEVLEAIDIGQDQEKGLLAANEAVHLEIEGASIEQRRERVLGGELFSSRSGPVSAPLSLSRRC